MILSQNPEPHSLRRRCRARLLAGVITLSIVWSAMARAQPVDAPERARGEALFREAKALVDKGDFDGGCPLFEQSLAALPSASTAIHVARCHEHGERYAAAIAAYDDALRLNAATDDERRAALEKIATEGRREAVARAPKLRIVLAPYLAKVPGLSVLLDGTPVSADAFDADRPVERGEHVIVARADLYSEKTIRVTTRVGETASAVIDLEVAPSTEPSGEHEPIRLPGPLASAARPTTPEPADDSVPVWAWVVGGVGVASLGVGVGLLVDSRLAAERLDACESYGEADLYACPTDAYVDLESIEGDIDRADIGLAVGVSLLAVGAAGISAGLAGILTASSSPQPEPSVAVVPVLTGDVAAVLVRGVY